MHRCLSVFLLLLPLVAYAGTPKQVDPYSGLLPDGFVVRDAPDALSPERLRTAKLAVVASANLEALTTQWVDYYERGGAERQAQVLSTMGAAMGAAGMASAQAGAQQGLDLNRQHGGIVRNASDPRNITDRVVAMLTPYFGQVVSTPDVATAIDEKADYVAIIDFYGRTYPPAINTRYRSEAGVHIFDVSLQRVLMATGKADIDREGDSLWQSPAAMISGMATTLAKGIQIPTDQIASTIRQQLGPPPAPPVVPPPAATPPQGAAAVVAPDQSPMGQCIALCKANTSRSAEQCFDSCNK